MKKLPIGKQVFKHIVEDGFIYVDKTEQLIELANRNIPIFLSRPRRFGKSLTTFTYKELFKGSRELFKNTYAYDHWDWSQKYSVVRLDMSIAVSSSIELLQKSIYSIVTEIASEYGLTLKEKLMPSMALRELITLLSEQNKVALIIDEYDAPILKTLHKPHLTEVKELLRDFYTVIKASEEYLAFVFITGISKFSKLGVFSAMNNLVDITLQKKYSVLLGYTQVEIATYFKEYIEQAKEKYRFSEEEFWEKLKHYYNGYSWDGETSVYNPFSVLNFFNTYMFRPYWMESGSPSYIVEYAEKNELSLEDLKKSLVDMDFMSRKDIDQAKPHSFLTQAGYLTIKETDEDGDYILDFPNYEVEHTFNTLLLETQYEVESDDLLGVKKSLKKALVDSNTEGIIEQFTIVYSSIPYVHFSNNKNEHFYHTMLLMFLRACGFEVLTEDLCNKGRSDLSLFWKERVYIIELKINGSAQSALSQIIENNYAGKYANKRVVHIGLNVSTEARNIVEWRIG